jgi:hypothetical protein
MMSLWPARPKGSPASATCSVDAHYDGKPVCTVTLPWVVEGHAILMADENVAASIAEERLASLASALAMPVCIIRRPVAA